MREFFQYRIEGCVETSMMCYNIGYFDKNGLWLTCVVSGFLYKHFYECEQAAKKTRQAVERAYEKHLGFHESRRMA